MEAFVAVAKAQGDESQRSSTTSLESSAFGSSCRSAGNATAGLNSGKGFSNLLPHHASDLSRRELLDNGHYWKYLTGEKTNNMTLPQEPAMATNDGVKGTPSPSSISAILAAEETSASNPTETSKELPEKVKAVNEEEKESPGEETSLKIRTSSPAALDSQSVGGSDVERFDGKIVYNPDGSAYIIEDSELSEDDGSLMNVPQLDGCIVDGGGTSLSPLTAIPHIANAFYVSRNPALYNALYGQALLQNKKIVPELPIMYSYRVYTLNSRFGDNNVSDTSGVNDENSKQKAGESGRTNGARDKDISNIPSSMEHEIPVKPILMCMICRLSFGYTKSFIAHAMGDHNLILMDQEKDLFNQRNVSAIIQPVGKDKDPTISFLEPVANRVSGGVNQVPMNRALHQSLSKNDLPLRQTSLSLFRSNSNLSDDNANNIKSPPITSPDLLLPSPRQPSDILSQTPGSTPKISNPGMDLTRKSPASGRSSASPGANVSPAPSSSTPNLILNNLSPSGSQMSMGNLGGPPNFITGTTIGVCPEHLNGRPSGVDCSKCEMILNSSRMGALGNLHTRNSCKTLKCPKCNWHYKYQETLEIHMKEKHPDSETSCIYCIAGQPHPRLARGETYTCGYKPYRCEVCNYSTTTKGNLSIHMQSDKHLNNMQELQNGGVPPPESLVQQTAPQHQSHSHKSMSASLCPSPATASSSGPPSTNPKPKPTFRCEVCNYETNVQRNLRIHMTSEKHTHNVMVLNQNLNQMKHISALQQVNPFDQAMLQFHPQMQQQMGTFNKDTPSALLQLHQQLQQQNENSSPQAEAALADMAYTQALLIQMMTGGQMPPHIPPDLAPHMDMGLNPDTMEPPPSNADPNPSHLFQCCVCNVFSTDSLEALSNHLTQDRTKLREHEILQLVAGNFLCRLCQYKTTLKANFQLHCKTDKHLQRLQHVNHVKEGGAQNEWKLKYSSMSNPVQLRCNCCDYYTNSLQKIAQIHSKHQRHELSVLIFRHLQSAEESINEHARIYACAYCGFTTRSGKLDLLQHSRSLKHLQTEQLICLQRRHEGKEGQPELAEVFRVLEQSSDCDSPSKNNHSMDFHEGQERRESKRDESKSVLKNALEKESSDSNDLTCPYCTFTSESETRLQAHLLTQHSNSVLSGSSSSSRERERLRDSSASAAHRNSISPDSKSEVPSEGMACPLCQDMCTTRTILETHLMNVHSVTVEGLQRLILLVNQSQWMNNSSTRVSANNLSSNSDMRSDSNDDDKDKSESESVLGDASDCDEFRCHTCSKCFRNVDELCCHQNELGHLEIKQTPSGPGYLCTKKLCNQYFPTVQSLQIHFKEIHSRGKPAMAVSEKHVYKYRCNECSLAFKTSEKLQLHSQYHAIRDASKCCLCGRSFRSLAALQKHVETSHTELNEEELLQFKQSLANNPLLLAGLSGQILDPLTTELLKKESARDEEMMDEDNRDDSMCDKDDVNEEGDGDSNDSIGTKEQKLVEDYLNTQVFAEDNYNDPNRKYKCHRCKVAFTHQNYLTSHNKTLLHRKGEKLSYPMEKYLDPNRPYKCEVCKESFTQKNILLVHYNSVSHLHKLKRAMQEQQQLLGQIPSSLTASLPPSATSLVTSTPKSTSSSSTTPSNMNLSSSPYLPSDDDDKKPYKCNICKVAHSQASTMDIHLRSVLHQTRQSKLQELAMTGQIDLTKPLIEQPEPQKVQDQHKKVMQEMLSPNKGDGGAPASFSTPIRSSSPMSNRSQTPNTSPPNMSVSPIPSSSPQTFSCPRCNFVCGSQEQLLQHKHLYCMFQTSMSLFPALTSPSSSSTPNASVLIESHSAPNNYEHPSPSSSPTPPALEEAFQRFSMPNKKSSHMFKHLLESYGFEMVMQFNEYHQKRLKREEDEEEPELDEQIAKDFPELAKATCQYCKKVFSSVWILKSHCEEIHQNNISMETLENFAEAFRGEYLKKVEAAEAAGEKESEDANKEGGHVSTSCSKNTSSHHPELSNVVATAPSTPTASTTPASSTESVGGNNNNASAAGHSSSNIPMSLAQHMNDVQAALNAMAASQMQHFNPMLNPMMMASLGMGFPLGLNMNALAAMNLQPPLVPMMMPPQLDAMNQNMPSQSSQYQQRLDPNAMSKQQQQILQQQQQASASQQKRARTRITDDQLKILRAHFDINNSPAEDQINQMAQQSGLPPKVIKHWFRNTLFKERQRNKDSPYNFSNPPSTTLNLEEYEKTGEAKVMPMPVEEQRQYVDLPATSIKKESHKKSSQHNHHHQSHLSQLALQQHEPLDMKFMNPSDSQSEFSDTESRYEDEKPVKMSRSKGGRGSPYSSGLSGGVNVSSHKNSVPEQSTSSSPNSLTLTSLITSQLNPQEDSNSSRNSQNMLPPPKMNNFATPTQVPTSSLLSLASPVSLNSPGSGRSDTPLTTPPLPNSGNASSSSGKRANRTRFTDYQIKVLQEFFENNAYPKDDDLEYLSKLLGLSPRVIVVWFQNARQKARKVYENQPPVDSSGDESAGRFQRTPGLNYQCKKCLLVFQRYYELIRHQKTHCFKEEDAKRSAQAQAAAAQVAAAMSSEDSNSSNITDNSLASNAQSGRESANVSQSSANASSVFANELKKLESQGDASATFQCDQCKLVFQRFDLWREHQLVHIMNPNLFNSFSPESPFGILQHAHSQQQQQQLQIQQGQSQQLPMKEKEREMKDSFTESNSATSSVAGDATNKRKWSADELMTDDDKDEQPRDKRLRTTILPEQLDYLYQKYQIESNPSRKMLETIAREVGLKKRVVQVWFQNTRARARKGQFRVHEPVLGINKRCPFCRALFKVKSALETHLATKHADQYTKGDIEIENLPDDEEVIESASSPGDNTKVPISFGANSTNSSGAATSPSVPSFLHSLSTHAELESSLKKLYEESLKRYAKDVEASSQNGATPNDMRFIKSEVPSPSAPEHPTGDCPLDLSKPVDLTRALGKAEPMDTSIFDQDYLSDGDEELLQLNSPASSTASQIPSGSGTNSNANKRFRTKLKGFQVKVMKSLFADYKTPTMAECEILGRELGLVKRVIQVFFQNNRAKDKRTVSFQKTSAQEPESPQVCKFCDFKYCNKYAVQDHIFTKRHIDNVKKHIEREACLSDQKKTQRDLKGTRALKNSFRDTTAPSTSVTLPGLSNDEMMMNLLQVYGLATGTCSIDTNNAPSSSSVLSTSSGK